MDDKLIHLLAKKWLSTLLLLLSWVTFVGCGKDGPSRLDVWGAITWKGQPVPSGVIFFEPNTTKGNKGPQGFALIKEGKFDTRYERSKGCMAGPHVATIQGGDGQGKTSGRPYGRSLFASYNVEIDIPPDGGEINIEVPASVPPAPATASEESE
jgi:hypothetical protein